MLKVFKYPETPDQDKFSSGALEFGLQEGASLEPLPFYTTGNNSAIVSFTAVEFDQYRKEVGRIDLDTNLIEVDSTNNIYNVDGLTEYAEALENGVYRFEFQNGSNLWITEYFNVKDKPAFDASFKFTINTALGVGTTFALPLPSGETYNFTVNYGDGSGDKTVTAYNDANATYDYGVAFSGQITIAGKCGGWAFANGGDKLKVTSVDNWGDVAFDYLVAAFHGCINITTMNAGNISLGTINSLANFALNCNSMTSFDVSLWDISNIQILTNFVQSCASLTSLDVSNWGTGNVTTLLSFANGCTALTSIDVSNWDVSSCTTFSSSFQLCILLTSLDVSSWITTSATLFNAFARNCTSLTSLDVTGWDVSGVTSFNRFAFNCSGLIALDTDNWDTDAVTNCGEMAENCTILTSSFLNTLWWDRTIPITTFTDCFTAATSISNYASIPNAWKGL